MKCNYIILPESGPNTMNKDMLKVRRKINREKVVEPRIKNFYERL